MNKGFTIVEVLVSLSIILIIGGMMIYSYTGCLKASRDLYLREQTKLTLLEYMSYYSEAPLLPGVIQGDKVWSEKHIDGINLFNDGTNTRFRTFFGPIDPSSIVVSSFDGFAWSPVTFSATDSGAVLVSGIHRHIVLSYQLVGWDYVRDRRYNYGTSMILSYKNPIIDSVVTDDGIDIPLSDIQILNSSDSRVIVSTNVNKWVNLYYKTPINNSFRIERPNVNDYSFSENVISFNQDIKDHYISVSYLDDAFNIYETEMVKVNSFNQAILSRNILKINNIECLTIKALAEWHTEQYSKNIGYITVVNPND